LRAAVAEWQTCLPAGRRNRFKAYMHYVYVLKSLYRNYRYVGMCTTLDKRIKQHQFGQEKTTAPYRPFKVLFSEEHSNRVDARKREKYLKSGTGKEWIKANFE